MLLGQETVLIQPVVCCIFRGSRKEQCRDLRLRGPSVSRGPSHELSARVDADSQGAAVP